MEENINTVVHRWLKEDLKENWICIDATMGRGNDTLFLAQHASKVIAFDIQKEALEATKKRCKEMNNIEYHLLSHDKMESVVHTFVDCIVFNLGYLPHSDTAVITKIETTERALLASWNLLRKGGILLVVSYIGHEGGKAEHEIVRQFIDTHLKCVKTYRYQTKENSPVAYYLKKEE